MPSSVQESRYQRYHRAAAAKLRSLASNLLQIIVSKLALTDNKIGGERDVVNEGERWQRVRMAALEEMRGILPNIEILLGES